MTTESFALALVRYCHLQQASVEVWGETVAHFRARRAACGAMHLRWLAADVVYDRRPPFAERRDTAGALGLVVEPHHKYDHITAATFAPEDRPRPPNKSD